MKRVALIGATGSIGKQALEIIGAHPELELVAAASGSQAIDGLAPLTQVGGDLTELLEQAQPDSTEDHVFKILGLIWGAGSREAIHATAKALAALQRSDGGWGQVKALPSDAYATGQALVALKESGAVVPASPSYQRGIRYLLSSQLGDGSWYVRTRSIAFQPQFDSDFPHGTDQFISAAATNWASMALLSSVR